MARSLTPLRTLAVGFESTPGTLVAATFPVIGDALGFTEEIDRFFEDSPRGVRAPYTAGGTDVRKGSGFTYEGPLTWEEVLLPLQAGIATDAAPAGSGPYTWTHDPDLTAGASVSPVTAEFTMGDGSTDHLARRAGYVFCPSFEIAGGFGEIATLSYNLIGRAAQTLASPAKPSALTGRTRVPGSLFSLYIDDSWAGLGGTQKTGFLRSFRLAVNTGLRPAGNVEGRTDLDHTGILSGHLGIELEIVTEVEAAFATEIAKWRAQGDGGGNRFVRLEADNGAAAGANRKLTFDMALRYDEQPALSSDEGIEVATFKMTGDYDPTGAKMLVATLINGLSSRP